MEAYFAVMLEKIGHERPLILLLSLMHLDILKQAKFTDHEINNTKILASEKLHRQRISKEELAFALLEAELE